MAMGANVGMLPEPRQAVTTIPLTVLSVTFPILGSHLCSLLPTQSLDC